MGYEACIQALMKAGVVNTDASTAANSDSSEPIQGCIGAGTGATVGKIMGMKQAEKSGLGIYSVKAGTFIMTAIVVVNALGDISDYETGKTRIPVDSLHILARYYNLTVDYNSGASNVKTKYPQK